MDELIEFKTVAINVDVPRYDHEKTLMLNLSPRCVGSISPPNIHLLDNMVRLACDQFSDVTGRDALL